jgi:plastocyanin
LTRLTVGKNNGVKQAFVYLDGVPTPEDLRPRASVTVDQSRCEYGPHVRAVTAGTQLDIVNSDPILHNVHARQVTDRGVETLFNIAQPIRGQRTSVEPRLTRPGVVRLTCEAGHPWMTAYILVASHPYVSVTNDDGEFVIADVPAGTYPIQMWHEGVRLKRVLTSLQLFEYEDQYEMVQQVVVPPGGEAVVSFEFGLRAS